MDSKQLEKRKKVLLDLMNDKIYVPMKIKELAIILQVSKEERPDLELVLNELLAEGKIEISKRGKYKIAKEKTVTGTFVTHPKGFGFIEVEGRDDDIYVSEENIGNAFYGDVVQATLISGTTGKRQEGRITQVISHTVKEVVGIYEQSKHFGFVIPDNQKILQDIFIPQECAKGAVNGHKVIAEITSYGSSKKKPEGRITKIIGHISDPGTDVLSIVYAKDLPFEFPEKVLNQAERVKDEVSEADMQGRLDLRKVPMVTIDGEDAKDLDDAVSLEKDGNIWHLGVHIADVTNYVQENSALDWEAKKRGTSVYLVDRVIPMLPRRLSNGICSLNAGCDRLALSCLMDIDEKGKVIGSQIAETVICVDQRMTYTSVKKILEDQDAEEIEKYLNKILSNSVSVFDTRARKEEKESSYHNLLVGILTGNADWLVKSNAEAKEGFADIIVETDDPDAGIVVELKYTKEYKDMEQACQNALDQIKDRRYHEYLLNDGRNDIMLYGMAFCKKRCRVVVERM